MDVNRDSQSDGIEASHIFSGDRIAGPDEFTRRLLAHGLSASNSVGYQLHYESSGWLNLVLLASAGAKARGQSDNPVSVELLEASLLSMDECDVSGHLHSNFNSEVAQLVGNFEIVTADLVNCAIAVVAQAEPPLPGKTADPLRVLESFVNEGVLRGADDPFKYEIPRIVRAILIQAAKVGAESAPVRGGSKVELVLALERQMPKWARENADEFDLAFKTIHRFHDWDALARIWNRWAPYLWLSDWKSAASIYGPIPEYISATRLELEEAKLSALELNREPTSDEEPSLPDRLSRVTLYYTKLQRPVPIDEETLTPNQFAIATVHTMRASTIIGSPMIAHNAFETARELANADAVSVWNRSRLLLEGGVLYLVTGEVRRSVDLLQQALRLAESEPEGAGYILPEIRGFLSFGYRKLGIGWAAEQQWTLIADTAEVGIIGRRAKSIIEVAQAFQQLDQLNITAARNLASQALFSESGFEVAVPAMQLLTEAEAIVGTGQEHKANLDHFRFVLADRLKGYAALQRDLLFDSIWLEVKAGDLESASARLTLSDDQHPIAALMWAEIALRDSYWAKARAICHQIQTNDFADIRVKTTAAAISAAAAYQSGHLADAQLRFRQAWTGCRIASTALPLMQIPPAIRSELIYRDEDFLNWQEFARTLGMIDEDAFVIRDRVLKADESTSFDIKNSRLSKRELKLLALLSTEKSNTEIAKELGLQLGTVKNMLSKIYRKLGVRRRADAVEYAISSNLIP